MSIFKYVLIFLHFWVLLFIADIELHGQISATQNQIVYDTVLVYDTIPVYDTIWEYEIVYDTVWMVNPGQEDTTELKMIDPIKIRKLYYSPYNFDYPELTIHQIIILKKSDKSRSWKTKVQAELRKIKNGPSNGRNSGYSPPKLTLNPTKGRFDPKAFLTGNWSMDVYYGKNYQIPKMQFENNTLQIKTINDSIKWLPGSDYGIRINYKMFQLSLQTGMGLNEFKSEFHYNLYDMRIDSTPHVMPNPDPRIADSIYYYTYDTTRLKYPQSSINTNRYFEIPFIISYAFYLGRSEFNVKGGCVNLFHLSSQGRIFGDSLVVMDINRVNSFRPYQIALYVGLNYQFYLTNQIKLGVDAYYKYPFKETSSGLGAKWFISSYGINISVRYEF